MKTKGNTILITGGATGIGFALAQEFVKLGNEVIICGRRKKSLEEAKNKLPKMHIVECDISKEIERKKLFDWVTSNYPTINILLNKVLLR